MAAPRRKKAGAALRTNCGLGLLVQGEKEMVITRAQVPSCLRTTHGTRGHGTYGSYGSYGPLHAHDAVAGTACVALSDSSVSSRASEVATELWEPSEPWELSKSCNSWDASKPRRCGGGPSAA